MWRLVAILVAGACACGARQSAPPAPVARVAPRAPAPIVIDDGGPLASYPGTAGQALTCDDVCRVHHVPKCPGVGRAGTGALVVRGLAGKFVVAFDEGAQYEGREVDGAHVWERLPAGPVGVAVSAPLAAKAELELTCLPVHAGRSNEYDVGQLPYRGREERPCASGRGTIDGQGEPPPEYMGDHAPPIRATGPLGCRLETTADAAGKFTLAGVGDGVYLIESYGHYAAEVRVRDGSTASVDLRPLVLERERRDARQETCGCRRSSRIFARDWFLYHTYDPDSRREY